MLVILMTSQSKRFELIDRNSNINLIVLVTTSHFSVSADLTQLHRI